MEREFLRGVDFRLYVNTETYKAWVKLLQGLVSAKERDKMQWGYSRRYSSLHAPTPRLSVPNLTARARSVSPLPSLKAGYSFTFVAPPAYNSNPFSEAQKADTRRSHVPAGPGSKRQAVDAFSPRSAALSGPPSKRPISLDMSVVRPTHDAPASAGSAYPLSAFAKLSLNKLDTPSRSKPRSSQPAEESSAHTLAAPYSIHDRMSTPEPEVCPSLLNFTRSRLIFRSQNLYYYVLASSPADAEGDNRARKAVLRSHQPTYYTSPEYVPAPQPMYIQSARASPVQALPSLRYLNSHRQLLHHYPITNPNTPQQILPPIRVPGEEDHHHQRPPYSGQQSQSRVPVAPFANAGPPGVQQWTPATTSQLHAYTHARYAFPPVA